jgi:hypothetical protein
MRFAGRKASTILALLIVMAMLCSDSREMFRERGRRLM